MPTRQSAQTGATARSRPLDGSGRCEQTNRKRWPLAIIPESPSRTVPGYSFRSSTPVATKVISSAVPSGRGSIDAPSPR